MRIFLLLWVTVSCLCFVQAQDLKKMKKSELQAMIIEMGQEYDSLNKILNTKIAELKKAREYQDQLKADIGKLEEVVKVKENEITTLRNNLKDLEAKNLKTITGLEENLKQLRDTIEARNTQLDVLSRQLDQLKVENKYIIDSLQLKLEASVAATSEAILEKEQLIAEGEMAKTSTAINFLNEYYKNPGNLDRVQLELRLSKIMVNEHFFFNQNEKVYDSRESRWSASDEYSDYSAYADEARYHRSLQTEVGGTSEIFGVESLKWYRSLSIQKIDRDATLKVTPSSLADIQKNLPKISITKNKFFELKYPGGEEEALLYNVKIEEVYVHGKKIIRWEIANEEVNFGNDRESYTRDMIWRIFHVGNEAYLALSRPQLERLGLRFIPFVRSNPDSYQNVFFKIYENNQLISRGGDNLVEEELSLYSTDRKGYLMFLRPNPFRSRLTLVNPSTVVFLFKISPVGK